MATTTPVASGTTVSDQTVTSGNELDVSGTANTTTVQSGGNQTVEVGGVENNATIQSGGTETINGTINGSNVVTGSGTANSDLDYGTVTVNSGGIAQGTAANNYIVENGGILALALKSASANFVTVQTGGSLTINGNAPANNVTLAGGTLELQSAKADTTNTSGAPTASGTLTFATGSSSRLQIDVAQSGNNATTFAQTITGFAAGDVIDLKYITGASISQTADTSNPSNTDVTVSGTGGSETFVFVGATPTLATQTDQTTGGTDIVVCFCSGTLIRTADGDVAVQNLRVGDLVVTASGARRPIRWLGHRETDCAHHPEPRKVWPVRVRAGALGAGLPYTDLWISPGHALCLDDVLYPVRALVHGQAITQVERATVTYWHVELDSHDLLIANGAASESYLDTGNRLGFDNAPGAIDLYPDFEPLSTDGFCRPYVESGALLAAARYRLFGNRKTAARPAVHLVADDSVLEPVRRDNTITFVVPAGTRELRLISPQKAADGDDVRMIGVLISAITIDTGSERRDIALDHQGLFAGFHEIERSEAGTWRWTNGAAHFAKNLWADASGAFLLHLTGMFEHPAEVESMQIAA